MTRKQRNTYAIITGTVFILLYVGLSFLFQYPTEMQSRALLILIALGSSGFAAAIPGILNVKYSESISAGGALAVFVIVLFFEFDPIEHDRPSQIIEGSVMLGAMPFEFADVSLIHADDPAVSTNQNGYFKISAKGLSPHLDTLSFRIKSDALLIDELYHAPFTRDLIKIQIKQREERREKKADNASEASDQTDATVKPQPERSRPEGFCVECVATDRESAKQVNKKVRCNTDSLYIINYILGFSKASDEQGRDVSCKWLKEKPLTFYESSFRLQIRTGSHEDAATNELVSARFIGKLGRTFIADLNKPSPYDDRKRNAEDDYNVSHSADIGELSSIILTMRDREKDNKLNDWQIKSISVTDLNRGKRYNKNVDAWIGDEPNRGPDVEIRFDGL